MAADVTIGVFGSLCSIYSVAKDLWRNAKYRKNVSLSIYALNSFKETHTWSQQLREQAESLIYEPFSKDRSTDQTYVRLRQLRDKFDRLIETIEEYETEIFQTVDLSEKQIRNIKDDTIRSYLRVVAKCLEKIKKEIVNITPISKETIELLDDLSKDKYELSECNQKIKSIARRTIGPARQILLRADVMILKSISIINHFSKGLL